MPHFPSILYNFSKWLHLFASALFRYEDFFGGKKKTGQKKKSKRIDKYDDSDTGDEQSDDTGHDDNQVVNL